jgi:hypothetical protein
MSIHQLQIKARDEWYGCKNLQREYPTPEYYWWKKYQRIYCPQARAKAEVLHSMAWMPRR